MDIENLEEIKIIIKKIDELKALHEKLDMEEFNTRNNSKLRAENISYVLMMLGDELLYNGAQICRKEIDRQLVVMQENLNTL